MDGGGDGGGNNDGSGGGGELIGDGFDGERERERAREMQVSIVTLASVFPGFRFSPTDDELISYYLKKKLQRLDNAVDIIREIDFCGYEPWDLPAISNIQSDNEWYFFSARGRKYPNGSQSKRATESGYWKATGKERNVKSASGSQATIGTKKTLVFHTGRAPRGERTEWIMHEFRMSGTSQESLVLCRLRKNSDFRASERVSSSDHRNPPAIAIENSNSGTDGHVGGTSQGAKAVESPHGSKESTSSYTSHSGQNDSESPVGSSRSSQQMDWLMEDDCFADILKDDIIKLDESAMASITSSMPVGAPVPDVQPKSSQQLIQEAVSSRPVTLQGTAVRRIRLRRQRAHPKPSPLGRNQNQNQNQPSDWSSGSCLVGTISHPFESVVRNRAVSLLLAILVVVVLVFAYWDHEEVVYYKRYLSGCLAVGKRQLKFWLQQVW